MTDFLAEHTFVSIVVGCVLLLVMLAIYDIFVAGKKHTIMHNFPIVGRLRYWLETIGPEMRQYWVANDKEEMPFNRDERSWIFASAKSENNNFGFGTTEQLYGTGYPIIKHAAFPFPEIQAEYPDPTDKTYIPCLKVIGEMHGRARPFQPQSVINISAMSYGSLGERAISALNKGAKEANCYHNTGEGGVSPYHEFGADVMWQIGTGYFGARTPEGFSLDVLAAKVESNPNIRCIEIKLSQGAKPGKGGILPGVKVTPSIAAIRGIPVGQDCISPNAHSEFNDVDSLIDFVERIAQKTGIPVGIKSAIGVIGFWKELARRMVERGEGPDFIAIDGAEGGTGAAPLTFSDHVSLPFKIGFARLYPIFQAEGLSEGLIWIGSGKLGFPDRAIIAFAMGCDLIQVAREAMISIGCIQAQKCHTGHCPTGVATQNRWLQAGLHVDDKAPRLTNYMRSFRKEILSLSHACGYQHPCQFSGKEIEFCTGVNQFTALHKVLGYQRDRTGLLETRTHSSALPQKEKMVED